MNWKWLNDSEGRWKYRYAVPFFLILVAPFYWLLFTGHYWKAAVYFGLLFIAAKIAIEIMNRK